MLGRSIYPSITYPQCLMWYFRHFEFDLPLDSGTEDSPLLQHNQLSHVFLLHCQYCHVSFHHLAVVMSEGRTKRESWQRKRECHK